MGVVEQEGHLGSEGVYDGKSAYEEKLFVTTCLRGTEKQ